MKETVENHPRSPEMNNFNDALRRVLRVSKAELKKRLSQEEASKAGKPKRGPRPKSSTSSGAGGGIT
jgi:hypothetical protein